MRILSGGNVFAPISAAPSKILDIGAGWGAWCAEVANEHPTATVYGIDISPVNRPGAPANCEFMIGNLHDGLKFDDNSMDLVNSRLPRLSTYANSSIGLLWPQ